MFKALLVIVTVLSTVRLKGKYIMQTSTASQQDWKESTVQSSKRQKLPEFFYILLTAHLVTNSW